MNKYVGKNHRPTVHGIWERQLNNIHSYLLMCILVHIYSCSYAAIVYSYSFICNLIHTRSYLLLSIPIHIYSFKFLHIYPCLNSFISTLVHTHPYLLLYILIHIYPYSYPLISTLVHTHPYHVHTHSYVILFILIHIYSYSYSFICNLIHTHSYPPLFKPIHIYSSSNKTSQGQIRPLWQGRRTRHQQSIAIREK